MILLVNFQKQNSTKVNVTHYRSELSPETGIVYSEVLSVLLEGEGWYSALEQKAAQQVYAVSEGRIIQSPTTVAGHTDSERSISVL
jgi:hypothetical protein